MSVPRSVSRAIPRPPLAVQKGADNRLESLTTVAPSDVGNGLLQLKLQPLPFTLPRHPHCHNCLNLAKRQDGPPSAFVALSPPSPRNGDTKALPSLSLPRLRAGMPTIWQKPSLSLVICAKPNESKQKTQTSSGSFPIFRHQHIQPSYLYGGILYMTDSFHSVSSAKFTLVRAIASLEWDRLRADGGYPWPYQPGMLTYQIFCALYVIRIGPV